jgi:hypothetical protein
LVKSITFIDVTAECFPALFQQISEKRLKDARNPFLCPESRSDDKTVDPSKWLNTAICFEGEFNEAFPNYRAKNDLSFHQAKSLLLSTIDDAVEESGFGINHKQNKNLKSFKNLIERFDTTIKQKFEVSQANYREETADAINNICRMCGISKDVDLAEAYASYRNHTAHGEIRRPEMVDVATYRILRCFIYTINLKKAKVPTERIQDIIKRMF